MHGTQELSWLFLDLNSYFASVEQQDRPELRGRPIAVVPMDTDHTCAIAASYEAKAYGIKTGTIIRDAKRMCPKLICVMARHDIYVDYHHRVLDEVIKHVPINKIWSIDELSSRLPPRQRNREAAMDVARRIKDGLRKNVGEYIKCSIGLAPNGFLAKVATDMQKPDGLVVLEPHDLPGRLFSLKLTDLPGINVRMEERLRRAGIHTMEQFWNMSPRHARHAWGSVVGEKFWYNLHGYHIPDTETKTSMVGHSRILDPALRRTEAARLVARRLTVKAAARLRRKEFFATAFHLSVREPEGRRWSAEVRLAPAQDNFTFLRALDDLWRGMQKDLRPHTLKKVSVTMHGLRAPGDITPDLFDRISPTVQATQKRDEKLTAIMDDINKKYGSETLRLGVTPQTKAGFMGTKIAFSRIPDKAEFWE
ncbi:MAG: impB/mucB/samB family protein [Alphaproteobacteria bacterium]|nr:impB/mucB/samB family protein [Alphaproteobacteria bacterium]MBU0859168.1 impB/mucB/samB family protein [Alphaproteobacteria bacterium]